MSFTPVTSANDLCTNTVYLPQRNAASHQDQLYVYKAVYIPSFKFTYSSKCNLVYFLNVI